MTNEEELTKLREIEARCSAAAPEPWDRFHDNYDEGTWLIGQRQGSRHSFIEIVIAEGIDVDDAEFIAHARSDVPKLTTELRRFYELLEPFRTDENSSVEILEKIIRLMKGLCDPTQGPVISEGKAEA